MDQQPMMGTFLYSAKKQMHSQQSSPIWAKYLMHSRSGTTPFSLAASWHFLRAVSKPSMQSTSLSWGQVWLPTLAGWVSSMLKEKTATRRRAITRNFIVVDFILQSDDISIPLISHSGATFLARILQPQSVTATINNILTMLSLLTRRCHMLIRKSRKLGQDDPVIPDPTPSAVSAAAYPFHFGGLNTAPTNDEVIERLAVNDCTKYMKLYRNLLNAIEQQDKGTLNSMVEPRLVDPLCSISVQQTNNTAPISLEYAGTMMGMGVSFGDVDIDPAPVPANALNKTNVKLVMAKDMMGGDKMMRMMQEGMPILISYRIVFKSEHKLIPKGSKDNGEEEKHVLLLQQEVKKSFSEFSDLIKGGMNPSNFNHFRKAILENNLPWRVGNIDSFLKDPFDS